MLQTNNRRSFFPVCFYLNQIARNPNNEYLITPNKMFFPIAG